jgi:GWxTD domain-containing protein
MGVALGGDDSEPLKLWADYAAYRIDGDPDHSYIEIYFDLPRSQLKFEPDSSGYLAIIDFSISVFDSTGAKIDSAFWRAGNRIESLSVLDDINYLISDLVTDKFPVGRYSVKMTARSGLREGSCLINMVVPSFDSTSLDISTLQLAHDIHPDTAGKFIKAGHKVMPNPSGQFSQEANAIYIYAECYNLNTFPESDSSYSMKIDLFDDGGRLARSIPPAKYEKPGPSAAILTGFSTATLKRGIYSVRVTVVDGSDSVFASKSFALMASRERMRREMLQAILAEFPQANRIDDEEAAERFKEDISFIATSRELQLYNSLNLEGKANFQRDFWLARDPDTNTPENEYKLEHYRRIKYADDNFGQYKGFIRGWQTDMGRVYILYGEPTEIERYHSSIENRGWERWWYHGLEGGVYFIFVDFEDSGAFRLVHSSKQDEIKDYNWEDKVKMTLFQR